MKYMKTQIAVVLIARNEGERLRKALESIPNGLQIVYVDSKSTDDSVALAKQKGCIVVELDMSLPFTAARARNEGFAALIRRAAQIEYVQFMDGDCEIAPDWLPKAIAALTDHEEVALVCGRRREKYPQSSQYTSLVDMEWHTPLGYIEACGGDFLIRASAFQEVEGFDPSWIAGEEPEFCLRLYQRGWKLFATSQDDVSRCAYYMFFTALATFHTVRPCLCRRVLELRSHAGMLLPEAGPLHPFLVIFPAFYHPNHVHSESWA